MRPRAPEDCPRCSKWGVNLLDGPRSDVVPWSEKKSRAGRPKRIDQNVFACVNPQCEYYGVTDALIHALVSDGGRNGIQYWRCQACANRKTSRWGTPVYWLKTTIGRISMVMMSLSE